MKPRVEVPTVHLVNRLHPPAPARIGVVYQPLPRRLALSVAWLAVFWGACPWLAWLPPYYPWPVLSFCAGAFLAHRFWHGRWMVRYFAGACPRCGRPVRVEAGARIDLPHLVTCFGCHFESLLEVYRADEEERIAAGAGEAIRHARPDCAGSWREERVWEQDFVACDRCGTRHHATPALRAAAREENERGRLLERLAGEGKFLD